MSDDDDNWGYESDGAAGHDFGASSSLETKAEYRILDEEQLETEMNDLVENVAALTGFPNDVASMLLRCHNWSQETVSNKFFENSNKLLRDTGIDLKQPPTPVQNIKCLICLDTQFPRDCASLACAHWFCCGCWKNYFHDKIQQGKLSTRTNCPMYKCKNVVLDEQVKKLSQNEDWIKYKHALIRSFVEDNRLIKWCPAPGCDKAAKVSSAGVSTVHCSCGLSFCFLCNEEGHAPITCEQLQTWLEKCRNESETAHWIIANTRKCPKCLVRIEKNQGCNHMVCRSCKHEFCWVCMGSWAEHGNHTGGFYKCNKYDPKKKKPTGDQKTDEKADAKAELDRYLHYYQRYHNHHQSRQYAKQSIEAASKRMAELPAAALIDVQFLKEAREQVFECRNVLKYTYVFGYYLSPGPEKELFEFLQQNLEKATEQLSELTEQPIEKVNNAEITNFARVTKQFMNNLLEGISNGLTDSSINISNMS